ncbi:MAG: asparagine synthase-related protein, partial [Lentilitoribacter sp.]
MILGAFESNAGAVGSQIAQRFHQRLAIGGISYGDRGIFQRSGVTFVEQHLPVVSQNGENTQLDLAIPSCSLAIAIWGRIDNSRELWKSLDPDHAPASNRLLLALCYRKWGTDMGSHLIGDFTFAIFDWEKQTCLLVRDQMGTRPVFYTQTGSNVYFSSSLGELKALGLLSGRLDKQWLTQSIERSVGFPAVPLTAFPDAKRLPPGSALIIQKNSCKEVKYYNFPTKRVNENSEEEQIFEYRKRFEQAVKRRIPDGNLPIAVELSGGLDSSSIAAAIHSFAHKNVSLHALSTHEFTEDEKFIDFAKTNMPAMSYHLADRWDQAPDIWHENYQRCAGHPSSIPYNLQNGHLITIAQSL